MKDYKYLVFDGQYFLVRNFKALIPRFNSKVELKDDKDGKQQYYNSTLMMSDDVVKSFFYSIVKVIRDIASCRKIILCFDSAPYHKSLFLDDYKGSRYYVTEDDLLKIDREKDPLNYINIKEDIRLNEIKKEAKNFIIENFNKLGMYVLIHKGYEADDLAYLTAQHVENDNERSCLVSIDEDWSYLINKNVDWLKTNTQSIFNYEKILDRNRNYLPDMGISLFQYKAYWDSLFGSHNDLVETIKKGENIDLKEVIKNCLNEDYSNINDIDKFKAQLKSFNINDYPEYDQVMEKIKLIETEGSIMSIDEYDYFKLMNNFKVRTEYYSNYVKEIDSTMYK
jgi:hydrogenase maturation factor